MYHGLVQHLPQKGVYVSGLVTGSDNLAGAASSIQSFAPASSPLPSRLWSLRTAIKKLDAERSFDLFASHFGLYTLPLVGLTNGRPLVMHFHGPWSAESDAEDEAWWKVRAKSVLERLVYRRATRFIVLSSAFRSILIQNYDVPPDRVQVVPGGVDADRFDTGKSRQAAREYLSWPTDRPIVFSVRRLVQRTGLPRLIEAIDFVRDHIPEIQLYVGGKGPLRAELTRQIQDRDLTNHVELLGFIPDDDLPLAYRAADLSVVPTIAHEGFGLVVVESLAAGTPPLVTPVGGLPEIVAPLSDNLLLPDDRPPTIADHIRSSLDGTISLPGAESCQRYARAHYDWPEIAQQVLDVYSEVT